MKFIWFLIKNKAIYLRLKLIEVVVAVAAAVLVQGWTTRLVKFPQKLARKVAPFDGHHCDPNFNLKFKLKLNYS